MTQQPEKNEAEKQLLQTYATQARVIVTLQAFIMGSISRIEFQNKMAEFAAEKNVKLSVAHYRRAQPLFKKIKQFFLF